MCLLRPRAFLFSCTSWGFVLSIAEEPKLISWLPGDAYPRLHLESTMRGYCTLLNVCLYYKAVLNTQCGNLMFQLICDKYFPIMAGQLEGRVVLQPVGRRGAPFWATQTTCSEGTDGLKSSIPLRSQQCQRLSCCTFFNDNFYILKHVDGLFHLAGNICSVVPSNLKYLPHFYWCKCCLQVSLCYLSSPCFVSPGN